MNHAISAGVFLWSVGDKELAMEVLVLGVLRVWLAGWIDRLGRTA